MYFNTVIVVSLLVACSESASVNDNENVPLAIVTSNSVQFTPAKVGSVVAADLLSQTTLLSISENVDKVVFIVLPKLSFPRLVFDANYNNKKDTTFLSNALGSMNSVFYPAVSNIGRLYKSLGGGMTNLHLSSPNDVKGEDILNAGRKIQIILNSGTSLHDADNVFGKVLDILKENGGSYSMVYTASEPDEWIKGIPQSQEESVELSSHKEEALSRYRRAAEKKSGKKDAKNRKSPSYEKTNNTILVYGENCFLFYAQSISVEINNSTHPERKAAARLPNIYLNETELNCTTDGKSRDPFNLTIDYSSFTEDIGNFTELKVTFQVKMANPWEWHVHEIAVHYKTKIAGLDDGVAVFRPGSWLTAQVLFSYHCNNPERTLLVDKDRRLSGELTFGTIQAQAYDIEKSKFGWQCDCVGFFTSAIWAGIFVTVIYLLIIALAMVMLVNLETMDRFEDPKGHGLKIQASG